MESITPETCITNYQECVQILNDNWEKLPLLGPIPDYHLKEGQIVRYRGMVQDMHNPAYFFSKFETVNKINGSKETRFGKYKETLECNENETICFESNECENKERRPYYCISIPGLNDWAQPTFVPLTTEAITTSNIQCKRSADDMEVDSQNDATTEQVGTKKICNSETTSKQDKDKKLMELQFPIPGSKNHACLINLYDIEDGQIKVNDVIEAAGFFWRAPVVDPEEEENVLSCVIPRLHAIVHHKITNCNPLCTPNISTNDILSNAAGLRTDLHLGLTQLLFGDSLAADYLICNLLSTVFLRQDFLSLGKFSVNISNMPREKGYTEHIYKVLSKLLAKSHYLPFSIENMNSLQMLPEKDYDQNCLKSGILQLSDKTHLILDETKLNTGKLEERGVKNVKALNDLITTQKLEYNFKYYNMEFATDIPVLTLSEGKSILESDAHIILEPVESSISSIGESMEAVNKFLDGNLLTNIRLYLSLVPYAEYTLPEDLQQNIQDDFVKMRQEPGQKTSANDLHSLLVLARLLSLSYGQQMLTKELWEKCQEMEKTRKSRIDNKRRL